ncbi:MAG: hypothetical protein MN733_21935, partial [Nitrososphaera sp.]|nr:hypothetical protein [Nitrososphaera sp.]
MLPFAAALPKGSPTAKKNKKYDEMKNPIPSAIHERFSFSENLADGLHKHEASIGMMHNTEALLRLELEAGRTSDNVYQTAKA